MYVQEGTQEEVDTVIYAPACWEQQVGYQPPLSCVAALADYTDTVYVLGERGRTHPEMVPACDPGSPPSGGIGIPLLGGAVLTSCLWELT